MALVALDGMPLIPVGGYQRHLSPTSANLQSTTIDAVNEACIMFGYVYTEDGSSHTIDTTGSSSLGWRTAGVTFANAGTTVKVGLAAVDTATGPPGRAVNASNVITLDVSKSMVGGSAGITANAWQTHVPDTGTKTIANGDLVAFCVQATARAGADSITVSCSAVPTIVSIPAITQYVGGSYGAVDQLPNAVITFSDGTLGFFYGSSLFDGNATPLLWNSGSATKEYGNFIQLHVPCKAYGILAGVNFSGDTDLILYSDPLGTPVAKKTLSVDLNTTAQAATHSVYIGLFPAPYQVAANTPYALIYKPTSVTNITAFHKTLASSTHQKSESLGANCYAINRASGAFAAQNSSKDRFPIALLVGAFEHGVSSTYALGI